MTDRPIDLDQHRGMEARKATEKRRLTTGVAGQHAKRKSRQDELDGFLLAAPAANWADAVEKARYVLTHLGVALEGQDPRRKKLIASLIDDLERLLAESGSDLADLGDDST